MLPEKPPEKEPLPPLKPWPPKKVPVPPPMELPPKLLPPNELPLNELPPKEPPPKGLLPNELPPDGREALLVPIEPLEVLRTCASAEELPVNRAAVSRPRVSSRFAARLP